MKTLVIYKSHYGATKQYAQWIAEALNADVMENSKVKGDSVLPYDTIVLGGGLYAGGISGISLLDKIQKQIEGKEILVFIVGLSPPQDNIIPTAKGTIIKKIKFPIQNIDMFYMRGAMDFSKLSVVHRTMMGMLKKFLLKKENRTEEDEGMLACFDGNVDFLDKSYIEPLVEAAKSNKKV